VVAVVNDAPVPVAAGLQVPLVEVVLLAETLVAAVAADIPSFVDLVVAAVKASSCNAKAVASVVVGNKNVANHDSGIVEHVAAVA